ncbi:MAG: Type 1 glutamine amidotransferase-like domain-containing protein [Spirochaetes bacterium]|nr:Type 1 glutamine amidotransferase-like domain-containing protein [Spirochaetota bacterium]
MKKIKPVYLIAGGNWRKPGALMPILKEVMKAAGKEHPQIGYIGTANGDDPWFFDSINENLMSAGADSIRQIFLADNNADMKAAKSALSSVDAIFMSGGDVEEGMRWLNLHKLTPFLMELYANGVLFFGLSAGSIMLGKQWVRWKDPDDDSSASLFGCMGIAPVVCDTHAEKDKWEELITAVKLLGDKSKGYGIPAGGVIVAGADGGLSALVKPAALFVNNSGRVVRTDDIPVLK